MFGRWLLTWINARFCTITRKRNPIIYDYNMRGKALKRVEAQRDLGVLITCDARFNEHNYAKVNKANKMLGFIRRSLSSRSDQFLPTFRSLYVALLRSHLEYASEIWSPKSVTLIKLIEGVQRRERGFSYLIYHTMNAFSSSIFSHWCIKEKLKT